MLFVCKTETIHVGVGVLLIDISTVLHLYLWTLLVIILKFKKKNHRDLKQFTITYIIIVYAQYNIQTDFKLFISENYSYCFAVRGIDF